MSSPPTALLSRGFLCSLIFYVQAARACRDTGDGGGGRVFTAVSCYACNCIVSDPVTSPCPAPNTCAHLCALLYASTAFHLLKSQRPSGSLPRLLRRVSLRVSCVCVSSHGPDDAGARVCAFRHGAFLMSCSFHVLRSASCVGSWTPPRKKFPP